MAMNYAMVKPEMATACMRRVFDIAIGTKTGQLEQDGQKLEQSEPGLEQSELKTGKSEPKLGATEEKSEKGDSDGENGEKWTTLW